MEHTKCLVEAGVGRDGRRKWAGEGAHGQMTLNDFPKSEPDWEVSFSWLKKKKKTPNWEEQVSLFIKKNITVSFLHNEGHSGMENFILKVWR